MTLLFLFSEKGIQRIFSRRRRTSRQTRARRFPLRHVANCIYRLRCNHLCNEMPEYAGKYAKRIRASSGRVIHVYARAIKSPRLFPLQRFAACCFGNVTSALRVARANFRETSSIVTE